MKLFLKPLTLLLAFTLLLGAVCVAALAALLLGRRALRPGT